MKLYVDPFLTLEFVEQGFGSIGQFAKKWAARPTSHNRKLARDTSTIYAWINNGLPKQAETVYNFFGTLSGLASRSKRC